MTEVSLNTQFAVPAHIMHQLVGDEAVLLNLDSEQYFGLDAVGQRIWALLNEGLSAREAIDQLTAEYAVDAATAREETLSFIGELVERGLLEVQGAP